MIVTREAEKNQGKTSRNLQCNSTAHNRQSYRTSFTSIRKDRSTTRLAARTAHRASSHPSGAIPATSTIPNSRRRRAIILLLILATPSALRRMRLRLNVHRGRVRLGAPPGPSRHRRGIRRRRPCSRDDVIFRRVRWCG